MRAMRAAQFLKKVAQVGAGAPQSARLGRQDMTPAASKNKAASAAAAGRASQLQRRVALKRGHFEGTGAQKPVPKFMDVGVAKTAWPWRKEVRKLTERKKKKPCKEERGRKGPWKITLPTHLEQHMREWGPSMRKEFVAAAAKRGLRLPAKTISIGTDCSGFDAPIWALKAVAQPIRHLFSSEVAPKVRNMLQMNHKSAEIYPDMVKRDHRWQYLLQVDSRRKGKERRVRACINILTHVHMHTQCLRPSVAAARGPKSIELVSKNSVVGPQVESWKRRKSIPGGFLQRSWSSRGPKMPSSLPQRIPSRALQIDEHRSQEPNEKLFFWI